MGSLGSRPNMWPSWLKPPALSHYSSLFIHAATGICSDVLLFDSCWWLQPWLQWPLLSVTLRGLHRSSGREQILTTAQCRRSNRTERGGNKITKEDEAIILIIYSCVWRSILFRMLRPFPSSRNTRETWTEWRQMWFTREVVEHRDPWRDWKSENR